jgi:hypothetical protein
MSYHSSQSRLWNGALHRWPNTLQITWTLRAGGHLYVHSFDGSCVHGRPCDVCGSFVDADLRCWTSLHAAAYYNHVQIVEFLLEQNVALEVLDRDAKTALQLATEQKNSKIVQLITAKLHPEAAAPVPESDRFVPEAGAGIVEAKEEKKLSKPQPKKAPGKDAGTKSSASGKKSPQPVRKRN